MAAESTPLPARASDTSVSGSRAISPRVGRRPHLDRHVLAPLERAFAARTRAELDDLVDDLPPRSRTVRLLADAAYRAGSALTADRTGMGGRTGPAPDPARRRVRPPGRGPRLAMRLHAARGRRSRAATRCSCAARSGGWTIEDLGSLNGTRLNGWPVAIPTRVRSGDVLSFGGASYRVTALGLVAQQVLHERVDLLVAELALVARHHALAEARTPCRRRDRRSTRGRTARRSCPARASRQPRPAGRGWARCSPWRRPSPACGSRRSPRR